MLDTFLAVSVLAEEAAAEKSTGLIDVVPGLMVWTLITFAIVLLVLRRLAFGRIQEMIEKRRDTIREAQDHTMPRHPYRLYGTEFRELLAPRSY